MTLPAPNLDDRTFQVGCLRPRDQVHQDLGVAAGAEAVASLQGAAELAVVHVEIDYAGAHDEPARVVFRDLHVAGYRVHTITAPS